MKHCQLHVRTYWFTENATSLLINNIIKFDILPSAAVNVRLTCVKTRFFNEFFYLLSFLINKYPKSSRTEFNLHSY